VTLTTAAEWVAIVNPRSGGRPRSSVFVDRVRAAVPRVFLSEGPGHVDSLVRSCSAAAGILVAGGDGTLFEVLQACDRSRQTIALVPAGRGNSLAKDLGLTDAYAALDGIRNGADRAIDLLRVRLVHDDGRTWEGVSASNLAIGYPAEVARIAARWRRLGAASYAVGTCIAPTTPIDVRMKCDDGAPVAVGLTGLVISNSRYVGPFLGFPASNLFDGVFHTVEMHARGVRQLLHNASSLTGLGFFEPVVKRDLRAVFVALDRPSLLKIDGELREGVREIDVRIEPAAVTFRVPAPHA
jgi:diacylglycerol kinase family enzyme